MTKYYAGIGARSTPSHILSDITHLAKHFEALGYVLRSGGAKGADHAFQTGADHYIIYSPRHVFQKGGSAALKIAEAHHPAWHRCNDYVRRLHARNVFILLGHDLTRPVDFVQCWTPDGLITGGTGLGIRVAQTYDIPVYNLGTPPSPF